MAITGIVFIFEFNPLDSSATASYKLATSNMLDTYLGISLNKQVRYSDPNIVLVYTDSLSRYEMALLLEKIREGKPKIVGLDIIYKNPEKYENDMLLIESLRKLKDKVVVSCFLTDEVAEENMLKTFQGNFFDNLNFCQGGVNLQKTRDQVIRTFNPYLKYKQDTIFSLDFQIAKRVDPSSVEKLSRRNNLEEYINYNLPIFDEYSSSDIIKHPLFVKNKIVLLGDSALDYHLTPISNQMSGLKIHAYTLSTILSEAYISEISNFNRWMLTVFLIVVFLDIIELASKKIKKGMRVFIAFYVFISIWLFTFIGYAIFIHFNYVINFSIIRLAIAMTPVYADAFIVFENIIKRLKKR